MAWDKPASNTSAAQRRARAEKLRKFRGDSNEAKAKRAALDLRGTPDKRTTDSTARKESLFENAKRAKKDQGSAWNKDTGSKTLSEGTSKNQKRLGDQLARAGQQPEEIKQRNARDFRDLAKNSKKARKELEKALGDISKDDLEVILTSDKNLTEAEKKSLGIGGNKNKLDYQKLLKRLGLIGSAIGLITTPGSDSMSWEEKARQERRRRLNPCPRNRDYARYRGGAPRRCGGRSAQSRGATVYYDTPFQFRVSGQPAALRSGQKLGRDPGFDFLGSVAAQAKQSFDRKWN